MEMDVPQDIRAPDLATLDLYCDRVASAVGRLSVRVFGLPEADGIELAHHLGRALQLTNILRDIDEDAGIGRLYLPREGLLHAGITIDRSGSGDGESGAAQGMRAAGAARRAAFRSKADEIMSRNPRRVVRAPRIMSKYYHAILDLLVARGFAAPRDAGQLNNGRADRDPASLRDHLMQKTVHIIGAGVSGLAAAVRLANAGLPSPRPRGDAAGRRPLPFLFRRGDRPHHRQRQPSAAVGQPATRVAYARSIGTEAGLVGPKRAQFPFVDLATGQRWQLDLGDGRLAARGFSTQRVASPIRRLLDYLELAPLIWSPTSTAGRRRHPLRGHALSIGWCSRCCWRR